jgi:hypothetical protein
MDDLVTMAGFAAAAGCCTATLARWAKAGVALPPSRKIGRSKVYRRRDVEDFVATLSR